MKVYIIIEDFDHYASEVIAVYSYVHLAEDRLEYEALHGPGRMRIVECEVETFLGDRR